MDIGDRIKQNGTATSDAAYVLGGAAEPDFLTFMQGMGIPLNADSAGTLTYTDVPILVTQASGGWQIITATVTRDSSDVVSIGSGVVRASSTGSALGLTGGAAVLLEVVPSFWLFNSVSFGMLTPATLADRYQQRASCSNGGLMALGPRSAASKKHAAAIGQNAYAHSPYETVIGCGNWPDGDGGAAMRGAGVWMGKTTGTTPLKLSAADVDGAIASSDAVTMDSGLYVVRGVLTAIDHATGDKKIWDIAFAVETAFDYSASALVGTPTYTEFFESAGATAWSVAAVVDSGANTYSLEVTGEAATDISWVFTANTHYHLVYP